MDDEVGEKRRGRKRSESLTSSVSMSEGVLQQLHHLAEIQMILYCSLMARNVFQNPLQKVLPVLTSGMNGVSWRREKRVVHGVGDEFLCLFKALTASFGG